MSSQRPFNLIQAMREGVVTGDALDILPTLKPGSVDLQIGKPTSMTAA